jgi:hypothetical protein
LCAEHVRQLEGESPFEAGTIRKHRGGFWRPAPDRLKLQWRSWRPAPDHLECGGRAERWRWATGRRGSRDGDRRAKGRQNEASTPLWLDLGNVGQRSAVSGQQTVPSTFNPFNPQPRNPGTSPNRSPPRGRCGSKAASTAPRCFGDATDVRAGGLRRRTPSGPPPVGRRQQAAATSGQQATSGQRSAVSGQRSVFQPFNPFNPQPRNPGTHSDNGPRSP